MSRPNTSLGHILCRVLQTTEMTQLDRLLAPNIMYHAVIGLPWCFFWKHPKLRHYRGRFFFVTFCVSGGGGFYCVAVICLLTRGGRVTHICVRKLNIICSDNGLSPGRRQAIIWTNAGILLIRPLGTNFSEISKSIYFHLRKWIWKCRLIASILSRPQWVKPMSTTIRATKTVFCQSHHW